MLITQQPLTNEHAALLENKKLEQHLLAQCPESCDKIKWKKYVEYLCHVCIAPSASINGLHGGMQGARTILHFGATGQWVIGLSAWLGYSVSFSKAFAEGMNPAEDNHIPEAARTKVAVILSSLVSLVGALPSAVLTLSSSEHLRANTFRCLQGVSFRWLDFLFASTNGLANFALGLNEGSQWFANFKDFFTTLCDENKTNKDKVLLVVSGLLVAYLACTSLIGFTPPLVELITASGGSNCSAYTFGVFANAAEFMFATNMMFSVDADVACCCHIRNPLPEEAINNKVATSIAALLGLVSGFGMANFTYHSISNPMLAAIFTATAWTGGFWTTTKPAFQHCVKPMVGRSERCLTHLWQKGLSPSCN